MEILNFAVLPTVAGELAALRTAQRTKIDVS